jgi:hypothetical protein
MFKDIKVEEILVYLMLIVVGYYIAKMFSRSCNGFSVGGQMCNSNRHLRCPEGTIPKPNQESIRRTGGGNFVTDCCQ